MYLGTDIPKTKDECIGDKIMATIVSSSGFANPSYS